MHNYKIFNHKFHKYTIITFIFIFILMSTIPSFSSESNNLQTLNPSEITAECAILIEKNTGQILFEKNIHQQMYPASITKLMTAILILEDLDLNDIVEIDAETPFSDGNRIWVAEGEKFTVEQLLHAMLIISANDAATALAKHHSGSVENFAKKMNARAIELGALNTNFVNPNGLPNENHLTTAYDMAMIGKYASTIPKLLEIVQTSSYEIPPTNKTDEPRIIKTTNRFLYGKGKGNQITYKGELIDIKYDAVLGLKTGYTKAAGHTYVGYGHKNNMELISVILKSNKKHFYSDTRTLLDYGFDNFKKVTLVNKGKKIDTIKLQDDKNTQISLVAKETLDVYIPKQTIDGSWTSDVIINPNLSLPLPADGKLGTLTYSIGDNIIASTDLVTLQSISDKALLDEQLISINDKKSSIWIEFSKYSLWIKITIALLIWRTIITTIKMILKKRREK